MAGKTSKKSADNFEKMKREMTEKKQKATIQQDLLVIETDSKNNDCMKFLSDDGFIQKQEEILEVVIEDIYKSKDAFIIDKEFRKDTTLVVQPEVKENILEVKKIEIIVFRVDEEEFAIKICNIKEIIRIPEVAKVPGAPKYVIGLCSLRGDLLPVIDSRILFNMPHKEFNESSRIIVTDIHGTKVGVISDKVTEVLSIEEDSIKEPPCSIKGIDGGVVSGILMLNNGNRVIMLLDAEKIIGIGNLEAVVNVKPSSVENLRGADEITDEEEQIIIFNSGLEEFAFNIKNVKEIIRLPNIMKAPNTPSYIEGVFSIRKELMAVVSLGKLLGTNNQQPDEYSRVVILNNGSFSFGVIVDKVSHVTTVQRKLLKDSIQMANCDSTGYIKGIFNLNNGKRLVMLLEPLKLISSEGVISVMDDDYMKTVKDKELYIGEEDNSFEHIVVFKLDEEEYGIEINNVKEINRMSELTHFPGAPVFITGMVNLRGDIIPILNLRRLFYDEDSSSFSATKFLAVEFGNKRIGIMIDSTSEVLRFSKSYLEANPELFDGNNSYIDKIAKLNDGKRIVLILNLKAVLRFM